MPTKHTKYKKSKIKESVIQIHIMQWMAYCPHIWGFRNNTGAYKVTENNKERYIRYGHPGSADIIGLLSSGRYIAIEVKSLTGRQTEKQKEFQRIIEKMGGLYILARSIDDVAKVVAKELGVNISTFS